VENRIDLDVLELEPRRGADDQLLRGPWRGAAIEPPEGARCQTAASERIDKEDALSRDAGELRKRPIQSFIWEVVRDRDE
jgi:hypothetical protein